MKTLTEEVWALRQEGCTQERIAEVLGKSVRTIRRRYRESDLPPELKQLVKNSQLTVSNAFVLTSIKDADERQVALKKCLAENLTARGLKKATSDDPPSDQHCRRFGLPVTEGLIVTKPSNQEEYIARFECEFSSKEELVAKFRSLVEEL